MLKIEAIGQGRTLLWLHDWGFDPQIWFHQIDFFRSQYRNVLINYNLAELPPGIAYDSLLGLLCEAIRAEWPKEWEPPHALLASGLGAFLAYELIERGWRPEGLVLIGGIVRFTNDQDYLSGLPRTKVSAMRKELHEHPQRMLARYLRLAFEPEERRVPRELWQRPPSQALEFLKLAFDAMITHDYQELLPALDVRALVVQGEADRVTPIWQGQLLRRLLRRAELHLCPGAGHLPFVTHYANLNRRLARFLE
jgi:pimeloyl-[acyl-carrier protein] methyl ester esterase